MQDNSVNVDNKGKVLIGYFFTSMFCKTLKVNDYPGVRLSLWI